MDDNSEPFVEIIDFKRFPQKMKYGAIGRAFGKVQHGRKINYFSELVHVSQLDSNGNPNISVSQATSAILYKITAEVATALRFLQGCGWFSEEVEIVTTGLSQNDELAIEGWREEWNISARVDL